MAMSFELDDLKMPDELKVQIRSLVASGRYATETDFFVEAWEWFSAKLREMDQMLASLGPGLKLILISNAARSLREDVKDMRWK
jgi:Arc/MetJ-type ribon-helix-helix transcriptional regulator